MDGEVKSYTWYKDVTHSDGEKYRAVYFTAYRDGAFIRDADTGNYIPNQETNGYLLSNVYWFKFEPIKWRVLKEENGEALIFSEMVLDSQAYQNRVDDNGFYATDSQGNALIDGNGNKVYANNYAYSSIRAWLNADFYNTAFNETQKELILKTTVDNSATTLYDKESIYFCENTKDNIFYLSFKDATNSEYGFHSENVNYRDKFRQKTTTDYAKMQGCYVYTNTNLSSYDNHSWWSLRSPYSYDDDSVHTIDANGTAFYCVEVNSQSNGVVPALRIKLN